MPELTILAWGLLAIGAFLIGLAKAAIPGVTVSIALFAAVPPARESTSTILLLLIAGDLMVLWAYRRDAGGRALLRLAPAVLGLLLGVVFFAFASDVLVQRGIAVILLLVVAVTLWRRRKPAPVDKPAPRAAAVVYGGLGGFTTMVANAGGPVMSMYFLAARFPVRAFLGTTAWFFACVSLIKLPFSIGLGLITPPGLVMVALLIPLVAAGVLIGRVLATRIDQMLFDRTVIVVTIAGALYLLVGP